MKCNLEPNCKRILGSLLCSTRLRAAFSTSNPRRTRSNAGRTSARSLPGRTHDVRRLRPDWANGGLYALIFGFFFRPKGRPLLTSQGSPVCHSSVGCQLCSPLLRVLDRKLLMSPTFLLCACWHHVAQTCLLPCVVRYCPCSIGRLMHSPSHHLNCLHLSRCVMCAQGRQTGSNLNSEPKTSRFNQGERAHTWSQNARVPVCMGWECQDLCLLGRTPVVFPVRLYKLGHLDKS